MIVSEKDSFKRKIKWYLITLIIEDFVLLLWLAPPFLIFHNEILAFIWFLCGGFGTYKLIIYIENYIGVSCCMQNPNRYRLVRFELPYHPWIKCQETNEERQEKKWEINEKK